MYGTPKNHDDCQTSKAMARILPGEAPVSREIRSSRSQASTRTQEFGTTLHHLWINALIFVCTGDQLWWEYPSHRRRHGLGKQHRKWSAVALCRLHTHPLVWDGSAPCPSSLLYSPSSFPSCFLLSLPPLPPHLSFPCSILSSSGPTYSTRVGRGRRVCRLQAPAPSLDGLGGSKQPASNGEAVLESYRYVGAVFTASAAGFHPRPHSWQSPSAPILATPGPPYPPGRLPTAP